MPFMLAILIIEFNILQTVEVSDKVCERVVLWKLAYSSNQKYYQILLKQITFYVLFRKNARN